MPLASTFAAIRDLWRAFSPELRAETLTLFATIPGTIVLGTLISAALPGA